MSFTPSSIAKKILQRHLADEERKREEKEQRLINAQLRKASQEQKEEEFKKNLSEDSYFFEMMGCAILEAGLEKWESVLFLDDGTVDIEMFRQSGFDVYRSNAPNTEWLQHAFPDSLVCFDEMRLHTGEETAKLNKVHIRLVTLFESYFPIRWNLSRSAREIIDLLDLELLSNNAPLDEVRRSLKKILSASQPIISHLYDSEQIPEIVDTLRDLQGIFEEQIHKIPIIEINWNIENSEHITGDQTVDKAFCFFKADFLRWISTGDGNQFSIDLFSHVEKAIESGANELTLSFPRHGKNCWYSFSGDLIPYPPSSIMGFLYAFEYHSSLKTQRDQFLIHIEWDELVDFE